MKPTKVMTAVAMEPWVLVVLVVAQKAMSVRAKAPYME